MNRDNSSYNLLTLASSNRAMQTILDSANKKYNAPMWKAFTSVLPASRSKKFSSIIEETGIIVKASILGATDKKPLRSIEGALKQEGSMPKIGHGFKVDQSDINFVNELNLVDVDMAFKMTELYRNRASNIIGGFHAAWNSWVFEALSDQQITTTSLGGTPTVIDLNVPAKLKVKAKGTTAWFDSTGVGYNIVEDLIRMNKIADDDTSIPADRVFVCSKELMNKMLLDKGVLEVVKSVMPLINPTIVTEAMIRQALTATYGLPPIVSIDEKSRHEVDGIAVDSPASFNKGKIALIPAAQLFNLHNSPSDYVNDQNPATVKAFLEGGLIGALTKYGSEPIEVVTNMESWSFVTFKNPKNIVALDTTKFSATGR